MTFSGPWSSRSKNLANLFHTVRASTGTLSADHASSPALCCGDHAATNFAGRRSRCLRLLMCLLSLQLRCSPRSSPSPSVSREGDPDPKVRGSACTHSRQARAVFGPCKCLQASPRETFATRCNLAATSRQLQIADIVLPGRAPSRISCVRIGITVEPVRVTTLV